jgi:putative lipoprotein
MLRVGVSIVLAGWVAAMPLARSAVHGQSSRLTIKGSITYEAREALPSDSRAVVELRHIPALPAAPAVAGQRIDLKGKATPVSFEFAVERYRLVGGVTYIVRVAILSGTRAVWTSDDVKVDVTASDVDTGAITLQPVKPGPDLAR